jgi:hypothetical protein
MSEFFEVDIKGYDAKLPILQLPSGIKIAFFNLHGNRRIFLLCKASAPTGAENTASCVYVPVPIGAGHAAV